MVRQAYDAIGGEVSRYHGSYSIVELLVRHPWRVGCGHGRHVSMSGCQERVVLQLKQLCIEKSCLQNTWC